MGSGDNCPQLSAWRYNTGELSLAAQRPDYNVCPGVRQPIFALHRAQPQALVEARWGFLPSWAQARGPHRVKAQINARSETAANKPFWRRAFYRRRCVIPADWWYEWQAAGDAKQPFALRPADGEPFFLAGLWARSAARQAAADDNVTETTFAVLTAPAAAAIAHVHPRMPIALTDAGARAWIAAGDDDGDELAQRLARGAITDTEAWLIGTRVNRPANNDESLIAPRAQTSRAATKPVS